MGRVKGKIAVVTGGAMGIGRATCLLLAEEEAAVAVTDIDDNAGLAVVSQITKNGGKAQYWHMDVSNEEEVKHALENIYGNFGKIDILVNNAGISGVTKPTHEIEENEWNKVIDIDAKGVFFCCKHTVPYMIQGGGGSIVNISSVYGLVGAVGDSPPYPYHAAKGAVRLMTKSDALCYARHNIRVNSIHPSWIWTSLVEEVAKRSQGGLESLKEQIKSLVPLGYAGEPNDIAYGVLYLASGESKFVTGSELVIDGGYIAR